MLISLNWLKEYVDIKVSNEELVELIGSRLVEVEEAIDNTHKYDKVVAVEVKSAEKIPDTHLTLCKIDDGGVCEGKDVKRDEQGLIQVMCGAPNVRAGMYAAWIAPGAIVPMTYHDPAPFKIGVRKMLKQYDSYGMLAGADELDIGDDHSGIVELDPDTTKAGDDFAKLFGLDDIILDIENKSLTHRPDTFGIVGFAREVAGILGEKFETPSWMFEREEKVLDSKNIFPLEIEVKDAELCPRYTAFVLEKNGEFKKKYLSHRDTLLARSGMRPIDEVVDLTNYLMLLTGQPLHAFDYDKLIKVGGLKDQGKIVVRAAKEGEKMRLLNDEEIILTADDILITSNNVPIGLAGAMGGQNTMVDENTKRIVLESATFSLYNLRKTQMAHGVFSEAITRFTKGQPAGQTRAVAESFAEMIAPTYRLVQVADEYPGGTKEITVKTTQEQINNLLGTDYSVKKIKETLENVNFIVKTAGEKIEVGVPYWRSDIEIHEDVTEEVGRLLGYDNILPTIPPHSTPTENRLFSLKKELREILASFGANEILTYSFVHGDLLKTVGEDPKNSYRIINSISPDLQYIRQNIAPSLLVKACENLKAGYDKFVLFEVNEVFPKTLGLDEDGVPEFADHLALVSADKNTDSQFYNLKSYVVKMGKRLGLKIDCKKFVAEKDQTTAYYEPIRSADLYVGEEKVGVLGELKNSVTRALKLPKGTTAAELDTGLLLKLRGVHKKEFKFSQYPKVARDLTLNVKIDAIYEDYYQKIVRVLDKTGLFYAVEPTSIYVPDNNAEKHLSFHIELQSPDKTLANEEIKVIMDKLADLEKS